MRKRHTIPPVRKAQYCRGRMNKTEARYAERLEVLKAAGDVLGWHFEGVTLRLAKRTTYTPDFMVVKPDCIEIHEVKGFWRDDARVKWKTAAEMFPWFRFLAIQEAKGGGWKIEIYEAALTKEGE